jgi:hypothetical protein
MDGFPNGRRLEDDVTTIELQAVSGVALAAIGLWYDDYTGTGSPVTPQLVNVLSFNAGVTKNDTSFKTAFPFMQAPWRGFTGAQYTGPKSVTAGLGLSANPVDLAAFPNPFKKAVTFHYKISSLSGGVVIKIVDATGKMVGTLGEGTKEIGDYYVQWAPTALAAGTYYARLYAGTEKSQTIVVVKTN